MRRKLHCAEEECFLGVGVGEGGVKVVHFPVLAAALQPHPIISLHKGLQLATHPK